MKVMAIIVIQWRNAVMWYEMIMVMKQPNIINGNISNGNINAMAIMIMANEMMTG
jgi:hypothetical protein